MNRRDFITLLGGAAAAWPLAASAQQSEKLPAIGFLGSTTPSAESQRTAAFVQRLRELGWIEGRTIAIEYRWGEGRPERFAEIAAEFVRLKVDVMIAGGTPTAAGRKAQAVAAVPDALVDEIALVGSADRIRDRLQAWKDGGNSGTSIPCCSAATSTRKHCG
jgi:putative ABC transport system substrate-binding protein